MFEGREGKEEGEGGLFPSRSRLKLIANARAAHVGSRSVAVADCSWILSFFKAFKDQAKMASESLRSYFWALLAFYLGVVTHLPASLSALFFLSFWLATGGASWCRLAYRTLPRDVNLLVRGLKLLGRMAWVKWNDIPITELFRRTAAAYPQKVMFVNVSSGQEWTFSQVCLISHFHVEGGILSWLCPPDLGKRRKEGRKDNKFTASIPSIEK